MTLFTLPVAGGCSIEVQSIPSLAIYEATSPPAQQMECERPDSQAVTRNAAAGQHVRGLLCSPERQPCAKRRQHAARELEQLLASLPDIDVGPPATPPDPTSNMQGQHCSSQAVLSSSLVQDTTENTQPKAQGTCQEAQSPERRARRARKMQHVPLRSSDSAQAADSSHSETTALPATVLYEPWTHKQLKRHKRQGKLVPIVHHAVQACKLGAAQGMSVIKAGPDPALVVAIDQALKGTSRAPADSSMLIGTSKTRSIKGRPASTPRASAKKKAIPAGDAGPLRRRAIMVQSSTAREPTQFIAELQMDLAARILAKRPSVTASGRASGSLHAGASQARAILAPGKRPHLSASETAAIKGRAVVQQPTPAGSTFLKMGHLAIGGAGASAFQRLLPRQQSTLLGGGNPGGMPQHSTVVDQASAFHSSDLRAPTQFLQPASMYPDGLSCLESVSAEERHLRPGALETLANAMAASEQTAAAVEMQLAGSTHRTSGPLSAASDRLPARPAGQESASVQYLRGFPITVEELCPGMTPMQAHAAQQQLAAGHIDLSGALQGYPVSMRAPSTQQGQLSQAQLEPSPGASMPSAGDALSAAMRSFSQETLQLTSATPQRHTSRGQAGRQPFSQAGTQAAHAGHWHAAAASGAQTEAAGVFASPTLLPLMESLPVTPLPGDDTLMGLWHSSGKKRWATLPHAAAWSPATHTWHTF